MNNIHKILLYLIVVSVIYFALSFFEKEVITYVPTFKNVNLISDITYKETAKKNKRNTAHLVASKKREATEYTNIEQFLNKNQIIDFDNDTTNFVFKTLAQKIQHLYQTKKGKIRIAWLGDSQIEGDLITQDIRKALQDHFNKQHGVGFIPIQCVSSNLRATASTKVSKNYTTHHFKQSTDKQLFLSGYAYTSKNMNFSFKDKTKKDTTQVLEKWLLYGKGAPIKITCNGKDSLYQANEYFNRILLDKSVKNTVNFSANFPNTPLYGVSFEPENGIVLDNFSFRGITGVELKRIHNELLTNLNHNKYYDLVVFQYGVNLMFRANDTNYEYYHKLMTPILNKFKKQMPTSEYLIFSCSDRAFKYNGMWESAIGIDNLIHTQASLAFENKIPFYNLFESMGGKGLMKKWCDTLPKLASKDYIHFNPKGAKIVAQVVAKTLIKEFKKNAQPKPKTSIKTTNKQNTNG